jgi:tRNA A37 methylthiotransferase MiaB
VQLTIVEEIFFHKITTFELSASQATTAAKVDDKKRKQIINFKINLLSIKNRFSVFLQQLVAALIYGWTIN